MRALLVCALLLLAPAAVPSASAYHIHCADPDDPLTGPACEFVAAVLNCAAHRLEGVPCTLP